MSLLFQTDNAALSLEHLKAKRDINTSNKLRLTEEFQRFEATQGECSSIDKFDKNDLIGQLLMM